MSIKIVIQDAAVLATNLEKLERILGPLSTGFTNLHGSLDGLGRRLTSAGTGFEAIINGTKGFGASIKRISDNVKPMSKALGDMAKAASDKRMDAIEKMANNINKLARSYERLAKARSGMAKTSIAFNRLVGGQTQLNQQLRSVMRLERDLSAHKERIDKREAREREKEEAEKKKRERPRGLFGLGRFAAFRGGATALGWIGHASGRLVRMTGLLFRAGYIADLYIRRIGQAIMTFIVRPIQKVTAAIADAGDKFRVFFAISSAKLGRIAMTSLTRDLFDVANQLGSDFTSLMENFQVLIKNPTIQDSLRDSMGRINKEALKELMMMMRAIEVAEPDLAARFPIMFPNIMGGNRRSFANALEMSVEDAPVIMRKVMQQAIDDATSPEMKAYYQKRLDSLPTIEDWHAGNERRLRFTTEALFTSIPRSVFDEIAKNFNSQINKIKNAFFMMFVELGNSGAYAKIVGVITKLADTLVYAVSSDMFDGLYADATKFFGWLSGELDKFVRTMFDKFDPAKNFIENVLGILSSIIEGTGNFLTNLSSKFNEVSNDAGGVPGLISFLVDIAGRILKNIDWFGDIFRVIVGILEELVHLFGLIFQVFAYYGSSVGTLASADAEFMGAKRAHILAEKEVKEFGKKLSDNLAKGIQPTQQESNRFTQLQLREQEAKAKREKTYKEFTDAAWNASPYGMIAPRGDKKGVFGILGDYAEGAHKRAISNNDIFSALDRLSSNNYSANTGGFEKFLNTLFSSSPKTSDPVTPDMLLNRMFATIGARQADAQHYNRAVVPTLQGTQRGKRIDPVVTQTVDEHGVIWFKLELVEKIVTSDGSEFNVGSPVEAMRVNYADFAEMSHHYTNNPSSFDDMAAMKGAGSRPYLDSMLRSGSNMYYGTTYMQQKALAERLAEENKPKLKVTATNANK